MITLFCFAHCCLAALEIYELLQSCLSIIIVANCLSELPQLYQVFSLMGFVVFHLTFMWPEIQEIALCAYYAMVCLSAVSWYFFTLKIPNIKVGVSGSKYFVTKDISKR